MLRSHQTGGWADQLVVSTANFVVLLMVARWAGVAELGFYSIAFSLLALAFALQDSLVTRPYTVQMLDATGDPRIHSSGALAFAAFLAAGLSLLAGLTAAILWLYRGEGGHPLTLAAALAVAFPLLMLREFARRYSFAHLRTWRILSADVTASALATAGMLLLASYGKLTAVMAILVLAGAAGVATAGWFLGNRTSFAFSAAGIRETIVRSAGLGKWLLSGQLAMQAQGYAAHWITLVIGGAAVTGLYAACLSIVALCNPFLYGYFNLLTPKFVRVLRDGGQVALRRQAAVSTLFLALVIGGFAVLIAFFGEWLLGLMFAAEDYRHASGVLTVLAFATFAGALGGPANVALTAAEQGRSIAAISGSVCIAGTGLVFLLMAGWGLEAAAYGILVTEAASSLAYWVLLHVQLPGERRSAIHSPNASAVQ